MEGIIMSVLRVPSLLVSITDDHGVQIALTRFIEAQRMLLLCHKHGGMDDIARAERHMQSAAVEYATASAAHVVDVGSVPVYMDQVVS